jgi:ribosomal protein S18 acetylase RimI-like enzyme
MSRLIKTSFQESDIDRREIQAFDYGSERWEIEVSTWLKSPDGKNSVIQDIRDFNTKVWLYWMDDKLVGFASWGEREWSYPPPKGKKQKISYIPYMGIDRNFRGEPKGGNKNDQYAYQILDDIIEYSATKTLLVPAIGLSVDQGNVRAIKFYTNRGFVSAKSSRQDKETGVIYERMFLNIEGLIQKGPA